MKKIYFFLSVLASILVWGWFFNYKMAITLVAAIVVHEYGHYYWMKVENIKKRTMMMLPPFGAVAISKEPWLNYGIENRIALAGPMIGLNALLGFYILLIITNKPIWAAAVVLTAYINLFNLLAPISVLDGGRVIKSILFSVNYNLGMIFVGLSLIFSIAFGIFRNPLWLIITYVAWQEMQYISKTKIQLMTLKEIMIGLGSFIMINAIYFYFLNLMHHYIAFSPLRITSLIQYF